VATLAGYLELGVSLPHALRAIPGLVSRETLLAVIVGESTGRLGQALSRVTQERSAQIWLQVVSRIFYPVLLLAFLAGVTSFWFDFVAGRMERIYRDFNLEVPTAMRQLQSAWDLFLESDIWVLQGGLAIVAILVLILCSSTLRWYLPLISRLYRLQVRAHFLKMLGLLVGAGKTIPEALTLLATSGHFAGAVRWRLWSACRLVENGTSLADSLRRRGLITRSMAPLVAAAQRAQNLPWALGELGETLSGRALRILLRISLVTTPVTVLIVGAVVAFVAIGIFSPLVELLQRLSG